MNNNLRDTLVRTQAKFPSHITQTQEIRVETLLKPGTTSYKLNLKQGSGTSDGPLENRLSDQDAFVLVALGLAIKKQDTSTSPMRYGNFPLFTYPEPQYFTGAPAGAPKEFEALLGIFNGKLTFKTNSSIVRIKEMPCYNFMFAPEGQVIKQATPAINDTLPQFGGISSESRGLLELQPTILIDGQVNNDIELTLGEGNFTAIDGSYTSGGAQTNTTRNVLVVRAFGLLVHNGSAAAKAYMSSWQ